MHAPSDNILQQVVMAMYQSRDDAQRRQINAFMTAFQEHPQSWTRVSVGFDLMKPNRNIGIILMLLAAGGHNFGNYSGRRLENTVRLSFFLTRLGAAG